jgi:hypothetical protein
MGKQNFNGFLTVCVPFQLNLGSAEKINRGIQYGFFYIFNKHVNLK